MFKKTSPKAQLNAFSSPNSYLSERAEQFYEQIGALAQSILQTGHFEGGGSFI